MTDEPDEPGQEPEPTEPDPEPSGKDEPDSFDREYVEKLRKENAAARKRAQEAESKVKEHEDSKKTAEQKRDEELANARDRATYADKLDVALEKAPDGMSAAQVRKLAKRLTGSTKAELEADADELFADFAPTGEDGTKGGGNGRRPQERLRPGAAPSSEPEETDPAKLAAQVPRMYQ